MPNVEQKQPDGFHYKGPAGEISASDHSVDGILKTFADLYFGTLDWAASHPMLFLVVAALVALIIVLHYFSRRHEREMRYDYMKWRDGAVIQKSLPFPEGPVALPKPNNDDGGKHA